MVFLAEIVALTAADIKNRILLFPDQDIMPETMNERLITRYVSITMMNANLQYDTLDSRLLSRNLPFHNILYDPGWIHLINVVAHTGDGVEVRSFNCF